MALDGERHGRRGLPEPTDPLRRCRAGPTRARPGTRPLQQARHYRGRRLAGAHLSARDRPPGRHSLHRSHGARRAAAAGALGPRGGRDLEGYPRRLAGDARRGNAQRAGIVDVVGLQAAADALQDALWDGMDGVVRQRARDGMNRRLALYVIEETALFAVYREEDTHLRASGLALAGQLAAHVAKALVGAQAFHQAGQNRLQIHPHTVATLLVWQLLGMLVK